MSEKNETTSSANWPKIYPHAEVDQATVEAFRKLLPVYSISCILSDVQERAGVMHSQIKLLDRKTKFAGPALTVKLYPGDLVDCLHALAAAQPGDVIVVDAAGETETSIWGGLMASLCKHKGVAGAVVDGSIRDTDEIRDIEFPIASRSAVPRSTHSPYSQRLDTLEINVPITCGGVLVNPGDIVVADEIGVVVVPKEKAPEVLRKAQAQAEQEEKTRARIREGKTVDELLAEFGRL
ncbi:MAG: RraA family protein [Bacillota bacterium]|nr:RraA family protein [Bacillota bacterium]